MTHEWNIARVRQLVGRSICSLIVARPGNPIWRTSRVVERPDLPEKQTAACLSSRRAEQLRASRRRELFSTHRGGLSVFQRKIYFSPNSFIVFPLRLFATPRCRSSRRKVDKEIRSHVSRINFSLAPVLLSAEFSNWCQCVSVSWIFSSS